MPIHLQRPSAHATRLAADPTYAAIHRAAAGAESALAADVARALTALRADVDRAALAAALARGDHVAAVAALGLDRLYQALAQAIHRQLSPVLRTLHTQAFAERAAVRLPTDLLTRLSGLIGRDVAAITETTRQAILRAIVDVLREGGNVDELAERLAERVGLTPRDATALARYEAGLRARGVAERQLRRQVADYRERLIRQRAQTIARTETMRVANLARRLRWEQASTRGQLDPARARRVWVATRDDRCCAACSAMDGQVAAIAGPYLGPDGFIDGPPLHPNCRCTEELEQT
ncbi:MAG TPA: phage minor head protein [Zeimonas sp.]|nr:phage minor head protein [Zeimonas sp.]